jgi:hypothetical protein
MSDQNKPWIDELITQALEYITKTLPFGNIPVVGSVINSIASQSIKIALEKTPLGSYITKQITDDVIKQSLAVKDARELLKKAQTTEQKLKAENDLKNSLRTLFDWSTK